MYKFELPTEKNVEIKPLTGAEELILTDQKLIKSGNAINKVFLNCVNFVEQSDKPTEETFLNMLAGDRLFILVKLREVSYGNEVEIGQNCTNGCGSFQDLINIQDLKITKYGDKREFSFILPQSKKTVIYKHLDGYMEQRLAKLGNTNIHSAMLMRIIFIDEKPPSSKSLLNLSSFDLMELRKHMAKNEAGINTLIKIECPICGTKHKSRLENQSSFLYPNLVQ